MAQINDAAFAALRQLGYTGALPDMRYAFQRDIGMRLSSLYLQATGLPHVSDAALEFWSNPEYYPQPIIDGLYANGEAGTFSDIRTYATSYFSDAGTTPAVISDPIYQINDQSGNGANWTQATATARPILQSDSSGEYLAFDLGDDVLNATLTAGTYTVVLPTREGIWIDEVVHAGGTFAVGPTSYTGGPARILEALATGGECRMIGPPMTVNRSLTAAERAALVQWFQNRGAGSTDLFGDDFVMFVDTTTASETFTIPTQDLGIFNATVDWGDGTTSEITTYNDAELTHTYASAGTHRIRISGSFPNIYFNNAGDRLKVRGIGNWGNAGFVSLVGAFYGCSNMQFAMQLGNCNTSQVTNMNTMFRDCSSVTALDVSGFDTSQVTNMSFMFRGCPNLATLDFSGFDTSQVTNMSDMFYGCSSLTTLDVSGFDTAQVTGMSSMFRSCSSLGPVAISGWNITSLTTAPAFMSGSNNALTQTEYDATLVAWEAQTEQPNVTIHFGDATYTAGSAAATARAALVANGWGITDGGAV